MWQSDLESVVSNMVGDTIKRHLHLNAKWYGNPKDSSFGIYIDLCWDGYSFGTTVVNFLDENSI
jgi:hypothetical protein